MSPRVLVVAVPGSESAGSVCAALAARGLTVDATDAPNALVALESKRPDVILLEVGEVPADGMEVLDRIRANPQQAGIPVILMAAEADDEDLFEGYKFGADYYLTKPLSPRHLLYAVGLVLGREFPE
jgi:DNA-binding response OmpR family regulator